MNITQLGLQAAAALGVNHPLTQTLPNDIEITVSGKTLTVQKDQLLHPRHFRNNIGRELRLEAIGIDDIPTLQLLTDLAEEWEAKKHIELVLEADAPTSPTVPGYTNWNHYSDHYVFEITLFPELYPAITHNQTGAFEGAVVIPIGNRRYRIKYQSPHDMDASGNKTTLSFIEVLDPLTQFDVCPLQTNYGEILPKPKTREEIRFFGQPSFIQSPVYPHHEGKPAPLLFCYENGWGDCGNENVFIALDQNGRPTRGWLEASCA